ncbi:hypothetical protein A1O1_07253 [Capronia coronata CBS 617.96]|uniref:Zn(2)-C6 fungal-type domain-containing protein n=1 Tax=Capronia coronata CBS 617.96 TaxID=1182541 RepID=W9YMY4_9EURO|nr:uncharacterized protein A1O1_07253 [Capronia coronata CBS 617.96]EXJ83629.1 hypothetical protein A1O1_07253 [Capronia coronata CBS 617.96]
MSAQAQAHDQATHSETPPNKRRRISLACNACRMRKSRCDGQRPSCASCIGLGFVCQYEPTDSAANVLVRKEYLSDLENRVAANERGVQRLDKLLKGHLSKCAESAVDGAMRPSQPSAASGATLPPEESPYRANVLEEPRDEDATTNGMAMTFTEERTSAYFGESSNLHFTRVLLRAAAAFHQSPSTATAQPTADNDSILVESNMERHSQHQSSPLSTVPNVPESALTALPSEEAMDNMLDIYFNTVGMVFPFIHEETTRNAYAEFKANGFTKVRRTWLGTLNMVFAMASKFDQYENEKASSKTRFDRSDVFYQRATGLCNEITKRVISIEIIHYLVLVVIHCQGTQRSSQAWNMHGLLVRSAIALGLHSDNHRKGLTPRTQETYRRTWLVIYGLDKVLSAVFGRPCAVVDEQAFSRQPLSWLSQTLRDGFTKAVDLPGQFLDVSFRLYQLMGMSLMKQYGANVEANNVELDDLASLQSTDELRMALKSWASNLPDQLRLCTPQSALLLENTQANRLCVILTLRYHNLNTLIHRPLLSATLSRASHGDNKNGGTSPYVFQLAMAGAYECVQSAESTIEIVHAILSTDPTSKNNLGVWYFTLYYAFTASLVISGRWLLAKHGQSTPDEAAIAHCQELLRKADTIFRALSHEDALVYSCSKYIRNLSDMLVSRAPIPSDETSGDLRSTATETQSEDSSAQANGGMYLNPEPLDAFEFLTSDLLEPSAFEGFGWAIDGTLRGIV